MIYEIREATWYVPSASDRHLRASSLTHVKTFATRVPGISAMFLCDEIIAEVAQTPDTRSFRHAHDLLLTSDICYAP
jgi:hypothetical protein